MNNKYIVPNFKSLIDYYNEVGFYDLEKLKFLKGEFRLDNIEDVGTQVLVLTGLGKQYILEGKIDEAYKVFIKAKSILLFNISNIHTDIIAFFYFEYSQLFIVFNDKKGRKYIEKALTYVKSKRLFTQINYISFKYSPHTKDEKYISDLISQVDQLKQVGKYSIYIMGLFRIGIAFKNINDYMNASQYFGIALKESKKYGLNHIGYNIRNSIGHLYILQNQLNKAITYLNIHKNDTESYTTRTLMIENIAYAYYLMRDYATASEEFLDAYNLAKINGVIQQLPIQCYYLGKCYDQLNQPRQALAYYKLGFENTNEQLKMGFSYTGDRKLAVEAYIQYLEKVAYSKFKDSPTEDVFQFALGKAWKEITHLFQYHLLTVHIRRVNQNEDLFKTLEMKESTFFAIKSRLAKHSFTLPNMKEVSKPFDPVHKVDPLILYIENNLMNFDWKEAHKRFEKDIFRFLYQQYGFQKKRLEDVLELSYSSVWAKMKIIEGPYTERN